MRLLRVCPENRRRYSIDLVCRFAVPVDGSTGFHFGIDDHGTIDITYAFINLLDVVSGDANSQGGVS